MPELPQRPTLPVNRITGRVGFIAVQAWRRSPTMRSAVELQVALQPAPGHSGFMPVYRTNICFN